MVAVPSIGRASLVEQPLVAPEASATQGLYERHAAKILGYCHHQLGSREEAEDAVQITFMNAFRALRKGVVPEAEAAWLFKIAENVCLSRRRSSWRRNRIESPADFEVIEEVVPGPNRQRDELIGIEDALASMPEQQRRAILLREWQGLSYREISEELELSQSAVETLIFRARRSLAQGLTDPDTVKPRRKSLRRALHLADLTTLLAAAKTMLTGAAAVKATTAAVAVTAIAGGAATVTPKLVHHDQKPARTAPAAVVPLVAAVADARGTAAPARDFAAVVGRAAPTVATSVRRDREAAGSAGAAAPSRRSQPVAAPKPAAGVAVVADAPDPVVEAPAPATLVPAAAPPAAVVPAPDEPKHEKPVREPAGHEPKAAEPAAEPKGNDKEKEQAKDREPARRAAAEPARDAGGNGNGRGHGKDDEKQEKGGKKDQAQPAAPVVVVAPSPEPAPPAPAAPIVPEPVQGDGKKRDKKEETAAPVAVLPIVAAAATAPAAEPGKDDQDKGRGKGK